MSTISLAKPDRRLTIILATCCLSLFVVGVDVTIVNIALPSIQRSFGASTAGRQWAVGGSTLNPVALAIIANTFTDPVKRARAMGVWGSVFGISLAVGPVLGGVLVGTIGWRSIL